MLAYDFYLRPVNEELGDIVDELNMRVFQNVLQLLYMLFREYPFWDRNIV